MFGISPYLYMMGGVAGGFGRHGLGEPDPAPVDPYAPDAEMRRRARNQGLTSLGLSLLESSGRGDLSGGLARGLAGFSAASAASLDRDRELARQRAEDERRAAAERRAEAAESRASAQEADRDRMADVSFDAATEELSVYRDTQARGRQLRERTGKSAEQMTAEIEALAAARPDDETLQRMSKRAIGYSLGEDSDLNKLATLHAEMTERAGRDADFDWETQAGLKRAGAQADHGFGPVAEGRRADRDDARADAGLAMERERLGIYRQEVTRRSEDRDDVPTSAINAYANDVEQELNAMIKPMVDARNAQAGKPDVEATARTGQLVTVKPMGPEEIDALKRRYEAAARANVERRRGAGAQAIRRLTYNPQTGELE